MSKAEERKKIPETCVRCGINDVRGNMRHTQLGFRAVWHCRDGAACEKRKKK